MNMRFVLTAAAFLAAVAGLAADEPVAVNPVSCGGCSAGCGSSAGIFGEIGFYVMKPRWENNPAYGISVTNADVTSFQQKDFDFDCDWAPRVSVGLASGCGLGGRLNYWSYRDSTSVSAAADDHFILSAEPAGVDIFASGNEIFTAESSLDLDVFDIEALYTTQAGDLGLLISGGVRFADLTQEYEAYAGVGPADPTTKSLHSSHDFDGAGLTAAAEMRYNMGMGLAPYANLRGSILFGNSKQTAIGVETSPAGDEIEINVISGNDTIPVGEIELGVAYSNNFGGLDGWLKVGVVSQTWFGAGTSSNVSSVVGILDNGANLSFIGLSVLGGIKY